ncbi:hypothetical protein K2173_006186 [Erythroxylum novogranatense]|uniref:SAP domain-containing protein n=1 Tax=Erythroxylum novogranatense TaxID=1862640 RepID=A0AAV8TDG7_9ROSI|nr:hypothetical protein K2173_006186 [Erythroxylum novogranatense]
MASPDGKRKVVTIYVSSSSSSEQDDDDDDDGDVVVVDAEEDGIYSEDEEYADERDDGDDDEMEESLCCKVICLLKEGNGLETLNLKECKAYLRKHSLRLSGSKAVYIERINEHFRIRHGSGEALYPRSSFVVNCKGDVCKGDVVLFTQKVRSRSGKILGTRTVAGRVVKESYGSAKQQHTFTVEVLWSRGIKKLPPLFPLLVKGRNLYRLRTFRQRWSNEAERVKVLAEKHQRGTAARLVRALRKSKLSCCSFLMLTGAKRQKISYQTKSSQTGKMAKQESRKRPEGHQKEILLRGTKCNNHRQLNLGSERSKTYWRSKKTGHLNNVIGPINQSYANHSHYQRKEFHSRGMPFYSSE